MTKKIFFIGFLFLAPAIAGMAQPGGGPGGGGDPGHGQPVPITGIEVLLVAGGALGVSRILKKKKANSEN